MGGDEKNRQENGLCLFWIICTLLKNDHQLEEYLQSATYFGEGMVEGGTLFFIDDKVSIFDISGSFLFIVD